MRKKMGLVEGGGDRRRIKHFFVEPHPIAI